MKTQILNKLVATALIACLGFMATSAIAGPDENQRMLQQQIIKSKQKMKEAAAAKGPERQKMMSEHMKMLHETMGMCRDMKPKAGMSVQERDEWFSEHQKLMDQMMEQMMEEHRMMMDMGKMPMDMGDMHKR
jgi:hypothetical protein